MGEGGNGRECEEGGEEEDRTHVDSSVVDSKAGARVGDEGRKKVDERKMKGERHFVFLSCLRAHDKEGKGEEEAF